MGDFEYWKIKPLLEHVKSADQLREIEVNSPQLMGETAELWQHFIKKVDLNWASKKYVPKNPQKWYEVYCKHKREAAEKYKQDEDDLRKRMQGLDKEKLDHTSRKVEMRDVPKLPRDSRMRPNNGGVPLTRGRMKRSKNESFLSWGGGSKTKTSTAQGVLLRARREAREMSERGRLTIPTNRLGGNRVARAPQSMIDGYRRAANEPMRIHTPSSRNDSTAAPREPVDPTQQARERRLRALTMGRAYGVGTGGVQMQMSEEQPEDRTERNILQETEIVAAQEARERSLRTFTMGGTYGVGTEGAQMLAMSEDESNSDNSPNKRMNPTQERRLAFTNARRYRVGHRGARTMSIFEEESSSEYRSGRTMPTETEVQPSLLSDPEISDPDDLFDEKPSPTERSAPSSSTQPKSNTKDPVTSTFKKPGPNAKIQSTQASNESSKSMNPPPTPSKSQKQGQQRAGSPPASDIGVPRPLRKRAPVDIFNRQAKRPRR